MPLSGESANSRTRGKSAGGRLSTTYQPLSSKWLAACDRPAPDIPVITTNSATPSG